jgi:hypothetical protein
MVRVVVSFVLAPLLVSMIYGPMGLVVVLPIVLLITALVATPLFFLFRWRGWLKWWQVGLAGLICGVMFSTLFGWPSPERLDDFGVQDALNFGGVVMLIAIVFWWLVRSAYESVLAPHEPLVYYALQTYLLADGAIWR